VTLPVKLKAGIKKGLNRVVEQGAMKYLMMDLLCLEAGDRYTENSALTEAVLVPLRGKGHAMIEDGMFVLSRRDVFSDKGCALYVPIGTDFIIQAESDLEIVICRATAQNKKSCIYIPSSQVKDKIVGKDTWQRKVVDIVDFSADTDRIIVGETYNQPGCWSSFPPHKHDTYIPDLETKMEEIYLFMVQPPEGFGIQRLYSYEGNFDVSFSIGCYDVITIPAGYHPVVAMPGYALYYLWILAGEERKLISNTDPRYKWFLEG
jgi:5-deoxy-glucuronate isomerase